MKLATAALVSYLNANLGADKTMFLSRLYTLLLINGTALYYTDGDVDFTPSLPVPAITVISPVSGALGSGTYYYKVSAILGPAHESLCSTEQSVTLSAGQGASISWAAVPGATGYKVYGRNTLIEQFMASVGPFTTSYTDLGTISPFGQPVTTIPTHLSVGPAIRRGKARSALGTELSTCDISMGGIVPIGAYTSPSQAALAGYFDGATVQIDKQFQATPGSNSLSPLPWFVGVVGDVTPTSSGVTLEVEGGTSLLENLQWPRRLLLAACPYSLYSKQCGASKFTNYGVAVATGTQTTTTVTVNGLAHKNYVLGTIVFSTGETRQITAMSTSGINDVLTLNYPIMAAQTPGNSVNCSPGCDKTFSGGGTAGALNCSAINSLGTSSAVFGATISGTSLTVASMTSGTIALQQAIFSPAGILCGVITAFGSGSGGTGTYTISNPNNVFTSGTFTGYPSNISRFGGFPWVPRPESAR